VSTRSPQSRRATPSLGREDNFARRAARGNFLRRLPRRLRRSPRLDGKQNFPSLATADRLKLKTAAISLALTLSLFPLAASSPSDTQSDAASASITITSQPTDDATLNLHRWGAVTLFHGLPSDRVNAIAEDASGALWFGTDGGLVRYDGRRTQVIAGEGALPSRRIRALKLDADGHLWIGTEVGAARLLGERVEVLEETRGRAVSGIAQSPRGEMALVTEQGEIIRYRAAETAGAREGAKSAGKLIALKLDPRAHPLLSVTARAKETRPLALTSIAFTGAGEWWIGTLGRSVLVNREREVREAALRPARPYLITAMHAAGERLWLGEQISRHGDGLWFYRDGSLTRFPLSTGAVTALDGSGDEVWVGTSGQGVFLLKQDNLAEHLTFENTAGGLRSNRVMAVFRDREGVVWFGTDRGVCRYDRDSFRPAALSNNAQSNFVRAMLDAASGEAWSGTNRGLFRLRAGAEMNQWAEVGEIRARSVYALLEDSAGALWAGTSSGLFVKPKDVDAFTLFAPGRGEITGEAEASEAASETAIPPPPNPPSEMQERESVRALALFRGQVYAAVFGRGIERIEAGQRTLVLHDAAAQRTLCLAAEGETALWIGTAEGEVWRFDGTQATPLSLPQGQTGWGAERAVRAINARSGRVWLGTAKGLWVWDGQKLEEVIPDADVWSLLVVAEGAGREVVWCGTQNAGLIKWLIEERVSIRFDTEQGLASQQVFALAAGSGARAGQLWIGTSRGVVLHQPSQAAPRLEFRRLVADQVYLPEALTAELLLPYPQKSFLLEVAALGSRTFPSQFQYQFTLTNHAGQALRNVLAQDGQFAVEGLSPGAYIIQTRAISRDLIYSTPLALRLRIPRAPFPWTTLLLASLLAVAVAAAAWAYRQQRRTARANRELAETNAELHETRIRLAKETESERSRIARDLHDQTLADLRHLLVLTDQLNAPAEEGAARAHRSATLRREIEAISSEIRHICEDLSPSALENIGFLPALEWALTDAVAHLPPGEKFACEFVCEPGLEERLDLSPTEQIQLYRLAQEAINNICRHARAGRARLAVSSENARDLVIEITDDGIGLSGAAPAHQTGHGMANMRSRANLIGARVKWHDAAPGCRVEVRKPQCVR
jgi:signal transduction histidine kinase/ligand-binding sensor domain-containing protein